MCVSATSHYLHSSTCSETESFLLKPATNLAHLPSDRHANVMSSHVKSPLLNPFSYSSLHKVKASCGFTMHSIAFVISLSVFPSSRHTLIPLQHHQPPQTHRHTPALGLCTFSSLFRILCLAWLLVCLLSGWLAFFRLLLKGHHSNSPLGISVEHLVAFFT